jgi:NDP-sugar pyrophosphorylase family protein
LKALLLAAGKGSRLGAAAGGVPKPLVAIGGTTPLQHSIAWVAPLVTEIWINLHHDAARIRARAGSSFGAVPIRYSYEPELLGTAGAWRRLAPEWTGPCLVVYGDNFMRFDLGALIAAHVAGGAVATIAVYDPRMHANTGIGGGRVEVAGTRVTRFVEGAGEFVEGAGEGLVNAGAYCIEPELAAQIPPGFSDFGRDILPGLAVAGRLAGHPIEPQGFCLGLDTPARLELARALAARAAAPAPAVEASSSYGPAVEAAP